MKRERQVGVRLDSDEYRLIEDAAEALRLPVAALVRFTAVYGAELILGRRIEESAPEAS